MEPTRAADAARTRPEPGPRPRCARSPAAHRPEISTWLPSDRRTVTVLFVDVTPTDADIDPEAGETIAAESLAGSPKRCAARARVEDSVSGGVMGWFGLPSAHDDDPLRAVLAAHQARQWVLALPGPREFRAGRNR